VPRCPLATAACNDLLPDPLPVAEGHRRACIAEVEAVTDLAAAPAPPPLPTPHVAAVGGAPVEELGIGGAEAAGALALEPAEGWAARAAGIGKVFKVRSGRGRKAGLGALRGVALDVREGECVALVGESGSGKSTLLRVLAGLEKQTRGDVLIGRGGRPQMVFQDAGASLTPWLTVGQLLDERLRTEGIPKAERRRRALEALRTTGLPESVYDARGTELSGGQRQRVALARATVVPPEVLLCDEPTSALDVSLAATVLNLIQELRRRLGMAVVFVTHDLSVARVVADRIAVMYLGRIVEIGDAEEVIRSPKHPYTKALLAAVPDFGVAPPALKGEPASPLSPPSGCEYHPRCPLAIDTCADPHLVVPLERLRVGRELLMDADSRRVACIRQKEI
jgi:peptide/nickel transport system ATP-binding protein